MNILRRLIRLQKKSIVVAPAPGRLMLSIFRPVATPSPSAWRQCYAYGWWTVRFFGLTRLTRRVWLWGGYIPWLNVSYIAILPFKRGGAK